MKKIGIIALCFIILGTGMILYGYFSHEESVVSNEEPVVSNEEPVVNTGVNGIKVAERYLAPEWDYSKKSRNTPIYGLNSIIFTSTRDFNDQIEELLSQIEYEREELRWTKPDDALMSLIETDPLFKEIKSTTNTMYSLYSLEGKIGEYYGKYTQQLTEHFVDYIIFDENVPDGFFISGIKNHMPRPVKVFVNFKPKTKESDCAIEKLQDFDEEKLLEVGRQLIGDEREVVIAQYLECDLNNDQKVEKIVNYNNFLSDPDVDEYLQDRESESIWQEKYYSILVILDDEYQPIGFIQSMPDFSGLDDNLQAYQIGETVVQYIVDLDNDEQMEIISFARGWEYDDYLFSKLTTDNVKSYYQRFFWVYY